MKKEYMAPVLEAIELITEDTILANSKTLGKGEDVGEEEIFDAD